ncbi:PulJ/GspJ family protein [Enterococcus casseliflavus]|nr:type II secretion system protein [Enterococcus casseliflavus]MEB6145951.1 type II secretion system GspH family protein [Enterococcus casseliflavus]
MKHGLQDERGVTLVELLGAIVIFGIIIALFSGTLFLIVQASVRQGRIAAFQGIANEIMAQAGQIAKIDGIYEHAGYLGKYDSLLFHEEHIVKTMPEGTLGAAITEEGSPRMVVTDITDTNNIRARVYDTKDPTIKLKIIQQKNENEATLTHHYTPNYRDTFSI